MIKANFYMQTENWVYLFNCMLPHTSLNVCTDLNMQLLIKTFVLWCHGSHISNKLKELVVNCKASNTDVAARGSKFMKHGFFTHMMFNPAAHIYPISTVYVQPFIICVWIRWLKWLCRDLDIIPPVTAVASVIFLFMGCAVMDCIFTINTTFKLHVCHLSTCFVFSSNLKDIYYPHAFIGRAALNSAWTWKLHLFKEIIRCWKLNC